MILSGVGLIGRNKEKAEQNDLAILEKGMEVEVTAKEPVRFLLLAAQPLNEGGKGMATAVVIISLSLTCFRPSS